MIFLDEKNGYLGFLLNPETFFCLSIRLYIPVLSEFLAKSIFWRSFDAVGYITGPPLNSLREDTLSEALFLASLNACKIESPSIKFP